MSEYEPKVGDRVRVTFEGTVDALDPSNNRVRVSGAGDRFHRTFAWAESEHVEKLADPEPEWVNGDIISVSYPHGFSDVIAVRVKGQWVDVNNAQEYGRLASNHWPDSLTIIHRVDAA